MIIEYFHCKITAIVVSFVQPAYVYFVYFFQWNGEDIPIWNRVETVSDLIYCTH